MNVWNCIILPIVWKKILLLLLSYNIHIKFLICFFKFLFKILTEESLISKKIYILFNNYFTNIIHLYILGKLVCNGFVHYDTNMNTIPNTTMYNKHGYNLFLIFFTRPLKAARPLNTFPLFKRVSHLGNDAFSEPLLPI